MSVEKERILKAARAIDIPEGRCGLWSIDKITTPLTVGSYHGKDVVLPGGTYTHLRRITWESLYFGGQVPVVMEDTPFELNTHLNFMLRARGQVLVTGLGLGCVVRGLLANPNVDHVLCLEKSVDVERLVRPYMPKTDRLSFLFIDAFEYPAKARKGFKFDYAWHDIWADRDNGDPHLDRLHMQLFKEFRDIATHQGMWRMDRVIKSKMKHLGMEVI